MTTTTIGTLYVALELGCDKWVLASATQAAEKPRFRTIAARNLAAFQEEIAKAKARFGLAADAPVCTCYEAGRDGFWLHRALTKMGVANVVVDASSIEVNRRQKQVKSDPVDATKLVNMLCRYWAGERKVWSVVKVPTVADEDHRQLHRGMKDLQRQKTECSNRIKGLLASQGLAAPVDAKFRATLAALRDWADQAVPAGMQLRLLQEFAVWEALHRQERDAANEQERQLRESKERPVEMMRRLMGLKAIGAQRVDPGDGVVLLARNQERQRTGRVGGPDADAVRQRQESTRARHQQVGQSPCALLDGGIGLDLVALAAGQRAEPMVREALRRRQ
jgi:transposase